MKKRTFIDLLESYKTLLDEKASYKYLHNFTSSNLINDEHASLLIYKTKTFLPNGKNIILFINKLILKINRIEDFEQFTKDHTVMKSKNFFMFLNIDSSLENLGDIAIYKDGEE